MKHTIIRSLIITLSLLANWPTQAQFTGKGGTVISSCDCDQRLNDLDVTFDIPMNADAYDIIGFRIVKSGTTISYVSFNARSVSRKGKITMNILHPNHQGYQAVWGEEYGKFHGNDFTNIDYRELCTGMGKTAKLKGEVIGIKQVGTETEYQYNESTGKIIAKTRRLYDGGTIISSTPELTVKQQSKVPERTYRFISAGMVAGAGLVAALMFQVFNKIQ